MLEVPIAHPPRDEVWTAPLAQCRTTTVPCDASQIESPAVAPISRPSAIPSHPLSPFPSVPERAPKTSATLEGSEGGRRGATNGRRGVRPRRRGLTPLVYSQRSCDQNLMRAPASDSTSVQEGAGGQGPTRSRTRCTKPRRRRSNRWSPRPRMPHPSKQAQHPSSPQQPPRPASSPSTGRPSTPATHQSTLRPAAPSASWDPTIPGKSQGVPY